MANILENVRTRACYYVWRESNGELTKREIALKVLSDDVLNRALDVEIPNIPFVDIGKIIEEYGIVNAIRLYCAVYMNNTIPDIEDLYRVIIKKQFKEWIESDEFDGEEVISWFITDDNDDYGDLRCEYDREA
jgi:hypothetical protein